MSNTITIAQALAEAFRSRAAQYDRTGAFRVEQSARRRSAWRYCQIIVLAGALSGMTARVAAASASDAVGLTEAVWQKQELPFTYQSSSLFHSCQVLENELRWILRGLGARDTLTLRIMQCDGKVGSAKLQITIESPVEATTQNIQRLINHDSRAELVSRVRGTRLPTAGDIPRFPAQWKQVTLTRDVSDCELVLQLRQQIFPKLSIRTQDNRRCDPAFRSYGRPRLIATALVASPASPAD